MDNQLSSDLYRLLLEQLLEGIIITDAEGKIIFVNPAAEQIRNLKKKTFYSTTCWAAIRLLRMKR